MKQKKRPKINSAVSKHKMVKVKFDFEKACVSGGGENVDQQYDMSSIFIITYPRNKKFN